MDISKEIRLAIHHIKGSFSDRWIEYCKEHNIAYKLVDCTQSDIIEQLKDCDGLLWHWGQTDYRHQLFARQLTFSLEKLGKKVFPSSLNSWHFDDKLGQKYLFESVGIPLIKSNVFYTKKDAFDWIDNTTLPKVFKLRGGAGSLNVKLISSKSQAKKIIRTAFGKGFPAFSRHQDIKEKFRKFLIYKDKKTVIKLLKAVVRLVYINPRVRLLPRDKGYVYFQDFIPQNDFDIRVNVIGDKCFATKRYVRKNDFRASGSGDFDRSPDQIDRDILKLAFSVSEKLEVDCLAFDFIYDKDKIKIIEISYAFPVIASDGNPGYWDKELNWHEGLFKSQYWMIENFVNSLKNNSQ